MTGRARRFGSAAAAAAALAVLAVGCTCEAGGRARRPCPGSDPACADAAVPADAGPRDAALDGAALPPDGAPGDDGGQACATPCEGDTPFCDVASGRCVACREDTDCVRLDAARCDPDTRACTPCRADPECSRFMDYQRCDLPTGICSECTGAREVELCEEFSCDALLRRCTDTLRGTLARCAACRATSECAQAGDRCVPMTFRGVAREGGFCLRPHDDACPRPFALETPARAALGTSAPLDTYCGFDEVVVTCEALADVGAPCELARDCGLGLGDGRCERVGAGRLCTVTCLDDADCPDEYRCTAAAGVDAGPLGGFCQPG